MKVFVNLIVLSALSLVVGCTSAQSRDLFFGVYNLSARETPQRVADLSGLTLWEYRYYNSRSKIAAVYWVHDNKNRDPAVAYFTPDDFYQNVTKMITKDRINPINGDRVDQWHMDGNDSSNWITFWNEHGEHHFSYLQANGPNRSVPLPEGVSWTFYFPRARF